MVKLVLQNAPPVQPFKVSIFIYLKFQLMPHHTDMPTCISVSLQFLLLKTSCSSFSNYTCTGSRIEIPHHYLASQSNVYITICKPSSDLISSLFKWRKKKPSVDLPSPQISSRSIFTITALLYKNDFIWPTLRKGFGSVRLPSHSFVDTWLRELLVFHEYFKVGSNWRKKKGAYIW